MTPTRPASPPSEPTTTAGDDAVARDVAAEPPLPGAGPVDGDWADREAAGRDRPDRDRTGGDAEDGALESLGKAVTDPVRTAADDSPDTPAPGA